MPSDASVARNLFVMADQEDGTTDVSCYPRCGLLHVYVTDHPYDISNRCYLEKRDGPEM